MSYLGENTAASGTMLPSPSSICEALVFTYHEVGWVRTVGRNRLPLAPGACCFRQEESHGEQAGLRRYFGNWYSAGEQWSTESWSASDSFLFLSLLAWCHVGGTTFVCGA